MKYSCLVAVLLPLWLAACSSSDSAGTTMETENSVALQVVDAAGKPIMGAKARLRPLWFVADTSADSTSSLDSIQLAFGVRNLVTDARGWLHMDGLPLGTFRLEAEAGEFAGAVEFDHRDTTLAASLSAIGLGNRGTLEGHIDLPDSAAHAWVQVYGSDTKVRTDSEGNFTLDEQPPGVVRVRAIAHGEPSILAEDLAVVRSQLTIRMGTVSVPSLASEDPVTWRYDRSLAVADLINDWMEPVTSPTVVTIRLDMDEFDFSQTMSDGRDLRVTDALGNNLVHQRARWDADLGKAVVRVKVDPSEMDTILLRWGHPGAVNPGYTGLWDGLSDSLVAALYSVTVGTFESGSSRTDLPDPIPTTFWYLSSSPSGVFFPPQDSGLSIRLDSAGMGRSGSAVHLNFDAPSPQYVLLGATLSEDYRSIATLDSLVFWARGNAKISVAFEKFDGNATWLKAWSHPVVDSTWTRICIRPSDLLPADSSGQFVGWEGVRDSVTNLSIFANDGTDLWVDDVVLYGVNRQDLR